MTIGFRQLRDLIICPRERGILNYVQEHSIVEHDITSSNSVRQVQTFPNFLSFLLTGLLIELSREL